MSGTGGGGVSFLAQERNTKEDMHITFSIIVFILSSLV